MKESDKEVIRAVIRTLDGISVSGKRNIDGMLASILALEGLLIQKEEPENDILDNN